MVYAGNVLRRTGFTAPYPVKPVDIPGVDESQLHQLLANWFNENAGEPFKTEKELQMDRETRQAVNDMKAIHSKELEDLKESMQAEVRDLILSKLPKHSDIVRCPKCSHLLVLDETEINSKSRVLYNEAFGDNPERLTYTCGMCNNQWMTKTADVQ